MPLKFWKKQRSKSRGPSAVQGTITNEGYTCVPLRDQRVVEAGAGTKIKGAILGIAAVDALGGPVEFHPRFTFPYTTQFRSNTNFRDSSNRHLAPGVWTDDTSMTLSLARSIARYGFSEARQLEAYLDWFKRGELSAIGECFDIGGATRRALLLYEHAKSTVTPTDASEALAQIRVALGRNDTVAGNGSLMRLAPVGLAFWREPQLAKEYAGRSSATTHPAPICVETCEFWTALVVLIMTAACQSDSRPDPAGALTKLDLLRCISEYPFQNEKLKAALSLPQDTTTTGGGDDDGSMVISDSSAAETALEARYWSHHPILTLIAATRDSPSASKTGPFALPSAKALSSSGYVLHSAVAALYCFFATDNFEAGAVMAVNMGDDADTTGAIYAGIAGCWYADAMVLSSSSADPTGKNKKGGGDGTSDARGLFWTPNVQAWVLGLYRRDLVEQVAEELVQFEQEWKS